MINQHFAENVLLALTSRQSLDDLNVKYLIVALNFQKICKYEENASMESTYVSKGFSSDYLLFENSCKSFMSEAFDTFLGPAGRKKDG